MAHEGLPPTVLVVVLDALGRDTIERYLSKSDKELALPNLSRLGLGNILQPEYHDRIVPASSLDLAIAADPRSTWSDSVMGHRELMGFIDPTGYELFRDGFPLPYVEELSRRIGRGIIYNKRIGGDQAIEDNHSTHEKTGAVVLYASMCDPIAQVVAWEDKIPPDELARIAQTAFDVAMEQGVRITRVISRPYIIKGGGFVRTAGRRDVVIQMPSGVTTLIDILRDHHIHTVSVGKSSDVVNTTWDLNMDITGELPNELKMMYTNESAKDKNPYSVREALRALRENTGRPRFILCNLPDTDSLFGHNRKIEGSLDSLMAFDRAVPLLEAAMPRNGYLIVTADHGMIDGGDYGYHNREAVPILGRGINAQLLRDIMNVPSSSTTYAVVGYICAKIFGLGEEYLRRCNLASMIAR